MCPPQLLTLSRRRCAWFYHFLSIFYLLNLVLLVLSNLVSGNDKEISENDSSDGMRYFVFLFPSHEDLVRHP